jgi:hypothetical protein
MSSPSSWVMIRRSRSRARIKTLVPAQRRPMPMWWSRLLWRRVSLPSVSMRSRRTRKCSLMRMPWRAGMARGRVFQASAGSAAADGPVRPCGVVVGGELVELGLQAADSDGGVLSGEPFFQGLVEALDLAAGLRVVGPGMAVGDSQGGELAFERDPAAAAVQAGEDRAVEFLTDVKYFSWWS